jgi:hypothetical protein
LRFSSEVLAARVGLVLLLWRDCRETVWPVGLANGDELPLWKREVIILVVPGFAPVVPL